MNTEKNTKNTVVLAGFICFALGISAMSLTALSIFIYGPLLLASFILSIVAMANKKVLGGLILLLLTLIISPTLWVFQVSKGIADFAEQMSIGAENQNPEDPTFTDLNRKTEHTITEVYKDSVEVYDISARYFTGYLDKEEPGVRLKVKNIGNKNIGLLKIVIYFKDNDGRNIYEDDINIVNENAIFGDGKPLKPNYIAGTEGTEYYSIEGVPSEWNEGEISWKIGRIEFSDTEDD